MNAPTIYANLPFQIEPMRLADIPAVVALEKAAYGPHWSRKDYAYEVESSRLAHYLVLRLPQREELLVGQGGFWLMADEAHINTIVIDPVWQRLGLGQWLLLALIEKGQNVGATTATLEVRVSNDVAISLYQSCGFQQIAYRRRYYPNNGEDGLIMTTPTLASPDYQNLLQQKKTTLTDRLPALIDKINQLD